MKKYFAGFLCVVAVVALATLTSCSRSADAAKVTHDDPAPVTLATVELIPMDRSLLVIGTLFAKDEAMTSAQVEGQVEKTLVDFGDRVTEGQELARIDTTS